MSPRNRILVAVGAFVLAIAAFLVLRPGADEDSGVVTEPPAREEAPPPTGTVPEEAPVEEQAETVEVEIRDGRPVGGVQSATVSRGETVLLRFDSDTPDEIHLHGYDLYTDVGPGEPGEIEFEAAIDGVFEAELHDAGHVEVLRLSVQP